MLVGDRSAQVDESLHGSAHAIYLLVLSYQEGSFDMTRFSRPRCTTSLFELLEDRFALAANSVLGIDAAAIELQYRNKSPQAITHEIGGQFELYNRGTAAANYNGMELRYYLDPDGVDPQVQFDGANIPSNALSLSYNPDGYASVRVIKDFTVNPAQRLKVKFEITGGRFDQSNDPSWDPDLRTAAPTHAIAVFKDGSQIWGDSTADPPEGDTVSPSVVSIVTASENPSAAAQVDFLVTFDEPVTGVDVSDFVIAQTGLIGARVNSVAGSGDRYNVQVSSGTGNGSLSIAFDSTKGGSVYDLAGNIAVTDFSDSDIYEIDKPVDPRPGDPPTSDPPLAGPTVELLYRNKSTQPTTSEVEAHLELFNRSQTAEDFVGIEIRYYFTPDGFTPRVKLDKSNVAESALALEYNDAGYISISVVDSTVINARDRLMVRFKIEGGNFNQTNDTSWDPLATNLSTTDAIDTFWARDGDTEDPDDNPHPPGTADVPSDLMDNCNQWKITYPDGSEDKTLCGEANNEFFYVHDDGNAIVFRTPIRNDNGTTPNSSYIRSELRERREDGSSDIYWTTAGTHVVYAKQAITHLPIVKNHLVATQVHGNKADGIDDSMVLRLEGSHLFLSFNGGKLREDLTVTLNYTLGTVHEVLFEIVDGKHYAYYSEDGNLGDAYESGNAARYLVRDGGNDYVMDLNYDRTYFKLGNYTQSNSNREGSESDNPANYGEVVLYDFFVEHEY